MKNEESIYSLDNVDNQNKFNRESIISDIRSKLIGGLNEEDVKKFISIIDKKYQQLEQEMKGQINVAISSKNKLQTQLQSFVTKSTEEKKRLQESLDKVQKKLDAYVDECKNKDLTLQSLNNTNNSKITQLQNEIHQMAEERKELEKRLSESRLEIKQTKEYAAGFEQENNFLKSKIVDLEKEISSINPKDDEINKAFRELEQQIEIEKLLNEKQSIDLNNYKKKITSLEETIARNTIELDEQRKISKKNEQELKLEKAQVSSNKITGFKDEIENIYRKLENLSEEQIEINNELQRQLEVEQLRANKAENGLAELIKWVFELKEKIYHEQNLFETQFRQFTERYDRKQKSRCAG